MPYQPKPGATLDQIDTPALLLDLNAFERNVEIMASFFRDRPTSLRPHAKTHKCPEIARRQLAAGAIGITCAKVGEAEILVDAGIRDILIANEIVGPIKIGRLATLAERASMMVAVDDPANIADLSAVCQERGTSLRVLVEVDTGMGRCGVANAEQALDLARRVLDAPQLEFTGLMGYEGHLVMRPEREERAAGVEEAVGILKEAKERIEQEGIPVRIVSGGGTGTYDMTGASEPMTEIQAGSYVVMDTTYRRIRPEFATALTVLSSVVSRPLPERIVTDAGLKSMTKEFGWPEPLDAGPITVQALSEEHGRLSTEAPAEVRLRPGDKVRFIPSHCCTTINLHDRLYVVRGDRLVDIWPIAARGRGQ